MTLVMIMAKIKARIKLKIGPAATTEILAQTEARRIHSLDKTIRQLFLEMES